MNSSVSGVAIDSKQLDNLRATAHTAPNKALMAAAKQFEALFMQMLLKSMRDSVKPSGLFNSEGSKMYTEMFDTQIAQEMSGKGLGLADILVKQLGAVQGKGAADAASPGAAPAPASTTKGAPAGITGAAEGDPTLEIEQAIAAATEAAQGAPAAPGSSAAQAQGAALAQGTAQAQEFVDRMLPDALAAEEATGVPAEFILGQAALESGWGRRQPAGTDGRPSHNLFGIKADAGWTGATVAAVTTEYSNGMPRKVVQRFRAYGSYAEGFSDYARLLAANPRYAPALRSGRSAPQFAACLQSGGYATDPAYAEKLTRAINQTMALARTD